MRHAMLDEDGESTKPLDLEDDLGVCIGHFLFDFLLWSVLPQALQAPGGVP